MSKFKIGDRVSFLYFGDKKKGTILGHWPLEKCDDNNGYWRVNNDGSHVAVAEKNMRKLRPKKTRREFWVAVETKYPGASFKTFPTQEDAQDYIEDKTNVVGWEVVHLKEVLR